MNEQHDQAVDGALWKFHEQNTKERFFGVVEWHYQDGAVVLVRKHQTFKQKDLLRLAAE